jgi:hypothetical protein
VPEIRGTAQGVGPDFAARDAVSRGGGLLLDLARAYPVPGLRAWRREARLDRAAAEVRIADDWELDPWLGDGHEPPTTLRMLIAGQIRLAEGEARVEPLEGATPILIRWPREISATLVTRELDDPMLTGAWGSSLTRLDLDATGLRSVTVVVRQIQEGKP